MKHFISKTQKIGEIGEEKAVQYLIQNGFSIVERNVSNRYGEIDVVAKKDSEHYFFEVKTGKRGGLVHPAENLTKEKLRKVYISASHYALTHAIKHYRVQGILVFLGDVVSVEIIDLS